MIWLIAQLYLLRWIPGLATRRLRELLNASTENPMHRSDGDAAQKIQQRVRRSARWVLRSRCLDQSLLLCQLLRNAGIAADIKIGVRREQQLPRAHAWVEVNGVAIGEDAQQLQQFLPLAQARNTDGFD